MGNSSAWYVGHMLFYIFLFIIIRILVEKGKKSMKEGITFIVPVFNASKTVDRCIESLVGIKDAYVVAINDGSTDDSKDVLRTLEEKYNNLMVVNSENKGSSAARNKGLGLVETEYVGFCDADDYYEELSIESDVDDSADMIVFSFEYKGNIKYPDTNFYSDDEVLTSKQYLLEMNKHFYSMFFAATWNKIYKTEIIKKNKVKFDESIKYSEDMIFNIEYINHINNVAINTKKMYNYYLFKDENDNSVDPIEYYKNTVIRLNKFKEICQKMNIELDNYYNNMSMELIEPVKYILNHYKKKEAIDKFKDLFYKEDVIDSLKHYTKDSRRVKLLEDCIPAQKWTKMYYLAKMILIAKGD